MSYESAKAAFADWGVDAEAALTKLAEIPISMHCLEAIRRNRSGLWNSSPVLADGVSWDQHQRLENSVFGHISQWQMEPIQLFISAGEHARLEQKNSGMAF